MKYTVPVEILSVDPGGNIRSPDWIVTRNLGRKKNKAVCALVRIILVCKGRKPNLCYSKQKE